MSYVSTLKMFIRIYELGNMSAAARDQRISPAVASARLAELERHLGARLFNRTTRRLKPTEHGHVFYEGAGKIVLAIEEAEAALVVDTNSPRGTIFIGAPLGIGRRFIAPHVPEFKKKPHKHINKTAQHQQRRMSQTTTCFEHHKKTQTNMDAKPHMMNATSETTPF